MVDVKQRRQQAVWELMVEVKRIADVYALCPVCLMVAVTGSIMEDVKDGSLEHFTDRHAGDEFPEGTLQ